MIDKMIIHDCLTKRFPLIPNSALIDAGDLIYEHTPHLGQEVYVVAKEHNRYIVVKGTITSTRLLKTGAHSFSVEGTYSQLHYDGIVSKRYYQGNFTLNSVNKNVFLNAAGAKEADQVAFKKNQKLENKK